MALTETTHKVSTALGSGTPTTEDVTAMTTGTVIMDLGGRVMTKDTDGALRLLAESNIGHMSRPTESANTTRPSTVLAGEYWKTNTDIEYLFDGANDLPLSDTGLNDGDEWVDTTDKADPIIKIYHASGSVPKIKEWVALVGDTMTGNLTMNSNRVIFGNSAYIGDISGKPGFFTNGNVFNFETNSVGITIDDSKQNSIALHGNAILLLSQKGNGNSEKWFSMNMYDTGAKTSLSARDKDDTQIGDALTCATSIGDAQWQIGDRTIITDYTDRRLIYDDDEWNSTIIDEDFYGDSSIGIVQSALWVLIDSADIAHIQFKFRLKDFSVSIPTPEMEVASFKYKFWDKLLVQHPQIASISSGICNSATMTLGTWGSDFEARSVPTTAQRAYFITNDGGTLDLSFAGINKINTGSHTCTNAYVTGSMTLKVNRKGR